MDINDRKGLSLIELMVTIGMMGLLMATVVMVAHVQLKAWDESYTRAVIRGNLSQAMELVSDDLRQARSIDALTDSSVTFTADLGRGMLTYRLYLYNADDGYSLRLAEGIVDDGDGVVLSSGIVPSSPVFSMNGKVVAVHLTASSGNQQITMHTNIRPRNL